MTTRDLELLEERKDLAKEAAAHLYAHGARRVWVFGSIARRRRQDERSDIDLAVEGLPPNDYLRRLGEVMALTGLAVDLVELEKASPELRQQIEMFGLLIPNED
jgi:predicted nucleotidyltransferase